MINFLNQIKYFYIRNLKCKKNIHYHPEKDGIYLPEISHGICYACGACIKKEYDYVWRKCKNVR